MAYFQNKEYGAVLVIGNRIQKYVRLKVLIGEIYRLGLSVQDKCCLKQRVNHLKIDASVLGYKVTPVNKRYKMPQHTHGGRLSGSKDLLIQLKSAVITLRIFTDLTQTQIKAKLGVAANTCNKIYLKAYNDAGNTDFNDLLDTLSTKSDRPGRPLRV